MSATDLTAFVRGHPRLFVLTGAGISTDSGIPGYRDDDGAWQRPAPITLQAFLGSEGARRRYWARSLLGWPLIRSAAPNPAHHALAELERMGRIEKLLTQNVDRLHQRAGSERVTELHGRLDRVVCLGCGAIDERDRLQAALRAGNPDYADLIAASAPDGDADLDGVDFAGFQVPDCGACGGLLKPDVVFFGENVPHDRVRQAMAALARSDAMLVVGSSLMVRSGLRFVEAAIAAGQPVAAINLGRTRADDRLSLKLAQACAPALTQLVRTLTAHAAA